MKCPKCSAETTSFVDVEIKEGEVTVESDGQYDVGNIGTVGEEIRCPECGQPMFTPEEAAAGGLSLFEYAVKQFAKHL